jgi:hypothetical protein
MKTLSVVLSAKKILLMKTRFLSFISILILTSSLSFSQKVDQKIPYLKKQGTATQLIVDEKPFLILGGELGNSSASSIDYMKPYWEKLVALNMNTVLMPVYWELIEPEEGKFDFALVDKLIFEARIHNLKIVILWFGIWKNSMSCYAPMWVKTNLDRFPRSIDSLGNGIEILSAFDEENFTADSKVFIALMRHLKEIDSKVHTIIMVQVENEIGMLPYARDYSPIANKLFKQQVPIKLNNYLQKNANVLIPEVMQKWSNAGKKTEGSWEEIFGNDAGTEEYFMAWYFGQFANRLAEAGKKEYPLPMYVNAALNRPGIRPGQYPSAGPLPHLLDIWKAAAPNIDILAPDIYFPDIENWCKKYYRNGNPIFLPETYAGPMNGAAALFVIGNHDGIGYSPFSVESIENPEKSNLSKVYAVLKQLSPIILEKQGNGQIAGVYLDSIQDKSQISLNGYKLNFRHEKDWLKPAQPIPSMEQIAGCIVIADGKDQFIIAGSSILVTFEPNSPGNPIVGIGAIEEGIYENGVWKPGRRLNGDQDHQGRHVNLKSDTFTIQKVKLYRYK